MTDKSFYIYLYYTCSLYYQEIKQKTNIQHIKLINSLHDKEYFKLAEFVIYVIIFQSGHTPPQVTHMQQNNVMNSNLLAAEWKRTLTSHIQSASLNVNSLRKSTKSIGNAKCRLSAPIWDRWVKISLSVSSKIFHNASNCFITRVGPSIWKFSRWKIAMAC